MTNAPIQVYVSTYAKYNAGNLKGAWVDLETYNTVDQFNEHIAELHNNEVDPEFMIQDFEGFPREFYSESGLDSRVFEWLELTDSDRERVAAFLDCFGDCAGDLFEASENAFFGTAENDSDFAYELLESTGDLQQIPESLRSYFDYDAYARDLMISDFSSSNGFYFMSNW
jgi:antirestriction protein